MATAPDRFVVYRVVRTEPGVAIPSRGVALNVVRDGGRLSWTANGDEFLDWTETGKIRLLDARHFWLVRDDGVRYSFFPLTLAELKTTDAELAQANKLETDFDVQRWFARAATESDPRLRQYEVDFAEAAGTFSDETPEELMEGVVEERGKPAPLWSVRKWCFGAGGDDCYFFQKVSESPPKWIRLPSPRGGSSEDWKDSDPSLPKNSADLHSVIGPDGKREFTPERKRLHAEILSSIFSGKQKGNPPVAVFVMGPPASGKSSTQRQRSEMTRDAVAYIDPDEIRAQLPEFQEAVRQKVRNAGSISYEETQLINNMAVERAMNEGYDFVMDAAGGTSDKGIAWFKRTMQALKEKGYEVRVFMHQTEDVDKLLIRNEDRGIRTGRFVPPEMIEAAHKSLPRLFKEYEPLVDELRVYDTSGIDDDPPSRPVEVFVSSKRQGREVKDMEFMSSVFGVTESSVDMKKKLDMSPDALARRFVDDLVADAEHVRTSPPITSPGQGVVWKPFEPMETPSNWKLEAQAEAPEVILPRSVKLVDGVFYEQGAGGEWEREAPAGTQRTVTFESSGSAVYEKHPDGHWFRVG